MELLERHIEIALETPDGIKKLRELILSLAMQGKLVPQDPNDQPASELLKEIEAEKNKLIKEGKIKRQASLPPIREKEVPFEVPNGWVWVQLEDLCNIVTQGPNPKYNDENDPQYGVLKTKDFYDDRIIYNNVTNISKKLFDEHKRFKLITYDILFGLVGKGSTAKCNIYIEQNGLECIFTRATGLIRLTNIRLVSPRIIHSFFISSFGKAKSESITDGSTGQLVIKTSELKKVLIPLPPVAEQKRIVAKIDQLMTLCDKLEVERNDRNQKRLNIHTAAMNRLLSAPDKTTFNTSWGFIISNFGELYSAPQNVEELKKAILQLAVMGKLVPQDPNDQPANELLKEIEAEKKRLIKEGKIKRQQPLPPIKPAEIMYEVPKGWEWTQLNILGEINPRNNLDDEILAAFVPMPLISAEYGEMHSFEVKKWSEIKKGYTHFSENDVVLAKITPCFENGKSCVMKKLPNGVGAGTTELHVFRNFSSKMCPEYILAYLKSPQFILNGIPKMTGSAGQKRVSKEYFACSPFPLPPLAEQKRIVAKIDQLMELCNALEQQIKNSTNIQTAILNAVLAKM